MNKPQSIPTPADWHDIAATIIASTPVDSGAGVVALVGDLGVGKTTLVQAIAQALGVTEPVTSPTFTIMKRYETLDENISTLVHMDAYRLEHSDELEPLRFTELLQSPHTLICIEWADKIAAALPPDAVWFTLTVDSTGQHTIQKQ